MYLEFIADELFGKLPLVTQSKMIAMQKDCDSKLSIFSECLEIVVEESKSLHLTSNQSSQETGNRTQKQNSVQNTKVSRMRYQPQPTVSMIGSNKMSVSGGSLSNTQDNQVPTNAPMNNQKIKKCLYCGNFNHHNDECSRFPTVEARKNRLKALCQPNGYCDICLALNHRSSSCLFQGRKQCVYCNKSSHHRSLCYKQFNTGTLSKNNKRESSHLSTEQGPSVTGQSEMSVSQTEVEPVQLSIISQHVSISDIDLTYEKIPMVPMQFLKCSVKNPETGQVIEVNVLIDTGCKRTYISQSVAQKLNLRVKDTQELIVSTFGRSEITPIPSGMVDLGIQLLNGNYMYMTMFTVEHISSKFHLDPVPLSVQDRNIVKQLCTKQQLSENARDVELDMLIGIDYWPYISKSGSKQVQLSESGVTLTDSKLGWLPSGMIHKVQNQETPQVVSLALLKVEIEEDEYKGVDNLWRLESIGINDYQMSADDARAQKHFDETVSLRNNRICVSWPYKNPNPRLPDNYHLAYKRLVSLLRSLKRQPEEIQKKYKENFTEQLKKGIIEKVDCHTDDGTLKHYIPHHGVYTPQKNTTKLRIVFDASAKDGKQLSLNECLLRGPVLLDDLCGLLLRFRTKEIVLLADIEKAFLQIELYPQDREVTRFLWLKNPEKLTVENNIQLYRFCRVPFGIITSPYMLGAAVKWMLEQHDTFVAKNIKENLYVDNVVTGVKTVTEAKAFYEEAKELFSGVKMNLHEWSSNSPEFLSSIPEEDKVVTEKVKVLGVPWTLKSDTMSIPVPSLVTLQNCNTKRDILKQIASIYDPLGLISCFTVGAKLFLQSLWREQLDWDTSLSENQLKVWMDITHTVAEIESKTISRLCQIPEGSDCWLVSFADASKEAYSCTVYLRVETNTNTKAYLVFAKSRLVPKKGMSVPRAELMAVLLSVRTLKFVEKQLRIPITKKIVFSDSLCVLHWIQNNKPLKVFTENRVREIRSHENIEFRYVKTTENPADYSTKGALAKYFEWSVWLSGPTWLVSPIQKWPTWEQNFHDTNIKNKIQLEYKNTFVSGGGELVMLQPNAFIQNKTISLNKVFDIEKYSSLVKLLRSTALVLRFISLLKQKCLATSKGNTTPNETELSIEAQELQEAKVLWELSIQKESFTEKIKDHNFCLQLGLFTSEDGLIRCCGRIGHADLPTEQKYPKLLPKNHKYTELTVLAYHEWLMHAGVEHTLAALRQEYWLLQGRSTVRRIVKSLCQLCKIYYNQHYRYPPIASDLPKSRVTSEAPFSCVGIDLVGPYWCKLKESRGASRKVWICIFVCMQIRAVHLELLFESTAKNILFAFKRFIARRGKPRLIISDNASSFLLVRKVIANQGIQWNRNPVISPWYGGMYERLIGLVKTCLRKSIGKDSLTFEQFGTLLTEVESVINSRPLTYVASDIDSPKPLCPSDFLILNPQRQLLITDSKNLTDNSSGETNRRKLIHIWKQGQEYLERFWTIWKKFYLLSLREQHILNNKKSLAKSKGNYSPESGDVVIIKDDSLPRNLWKLGLITHIYRSDDSEVRTCQVRLSNGKETVHSVKNLFPLEIQNL